MSLQTARPGAPLERRLTAEYVAARVLLDASSFEEAAPKILEAICLTLGWEHGALWTVDREVDGLRCTEMWTHALGKLPRVRRPQSSHDLSPRYRSSRPRLGHW